MDLQALAHLYNLTGRTFVITGGAGILGGEIACALVGCGANVAILDRSPELAERLIHRIERMDQPGIGRAAIVFGDVLDREKLCEARDVIRAEFGGVYGLINAAGGNRPQATSSATQPFFDLPDDALRGVFDLNMMGTVLPSQVFGQVMREAGEGVILNFSSMSAMRPLTRCTRVLGGKGRDLQFHPVARCAYGAGIFAAHPGQRARAGFFLTDQNRFLLTDEATGALTARGQSIIAHTPMGRFGDPEDLLGATLWLLSPASAFVTGIVVPIDGGFSAFSGV